MMHLHEKVTIFNLDDFCEELMTRERWKLVLSLKDEFPDLKISMFTIPLLCSREWLKHVHETYPWIEMHYHGSDHKDKEEWTKPNPPNIVEEPFFVKGFKAPWWNISQENAEPLIKRGYIISTRKKNPIIGPKIYQFDSGEELRWNVAYRDGVNYKLHSHVQEQPTRDGLPEIYDTIRSYLKRTARFLFISQLF
jgi:hypothetical protein